MGFVYFHFYILGLASWIWTSPLTEGLDFESPSKSNSHESFNLEHWTWGNVQDWSLQCPSNAIWPFKMQPQIENEDVTWSTQYNFFVKRCSYETWLANVNCGLTLIFKMTKRRARRCCPGSDLGHPRDKWEYLPQLHFKNTWQTLTFAQSHRFTQCYKLKSSIPFRSMPFDRFSEVSIKYVKQLQYLSFWELNDSCTTLIWLLYLISIFLDWALGFQIASQLTSWNLRALENKTHMRPSILTTDVGWTNLHREVLCRSP